jgi:hypothetical protein
MQNINDITYEYLEIQAALNADNDHRRTLHKRLRALKTEIIAYLEARDSDTITCDGKHIAMSERKRTKPKKARTTTMRTILSEHNVPNIDAIMGALDVQMVASPRRRLKTLSTPPKSNQSVGQR